MVDDIPLIIQDKSFHDDGSLNDGASAFSQVGVLGDAILVNGTHDPHLRVTTELVRFRILNASDARVYDLGFPDGRRFWQVASDAGLLERPGETRRVQLSPGERAEIVVRMAPGERAVLRSFAPDLGSAFPLERLDGGDDTFDILQLRSGERLDPSPPLPDRLATVDRPNPAEATTTRRFELGSNQINGRGMDMGRVDEVVTQGDTEVWEVTNTDGYPHSFHPHLVRFAVLEIDGERPPQELTGWKDTIFLPANTSARIIAHFDGPTDPDTPYVFHCHVLRHEDSGMMGQFVVVEPEDGGGAGARVRAGAGAPPTGHARHHEG
jgi:blue copper oxidase